MQLLVLTMCVALVVVIDLPKQSVATPSPIVLSKCSTTLNPICMIMEVTVSDLASIDLFKNFVGS